MEKFSYSEQVFLSILYMALHSCQRVLDGEHAGIQCNMA